MLIPSVTHQTGGLSINYIYGLLAFPILTFIIPSTRIICGVIYGINEFIFYFRIFHLSIDSKRKTPHITFYAMREALNF